MDSFGEFSEQSSATARRTPNDLVEKAWIEFDKVQVDSFGEFSEESSATARRTMSLRLNLTQHGKTHQVQT